MFEKLAVVILKKLIAVLLKDWHLHRDPVKKPKVEEEGINDEQERISNI